MGYAHLGSVLYLFWSGFSSPTAAVVVPDVVFTLPARNNNVTLPARNNNFTLVDR